MPAPQGPTAPRLKKALTRRYCVALSLVFCILLSTFLVFTRQTSIAENDAYLINISGQQRMLSQRIALMASEVRRATNEAEAAQYAQRMDQAIERMFSNHVALSTGKLGAGASYSLSAPIHEKYFGEKGLDDRVRTYIMAAQSFLEYYREQGLDAIRAAVRAEDNVALARRGLLADLNATVQLYEAEAKARIKSFQRLESVFFAMGLVILFGEVCFIFRPMVRMIVIRTGDLEAKNSELLELSTKLLEKHRASSPTRPAAPQPAKNSS